MYILHLIYPVFCYHKQGYIIHLCASLHGHCVTTLRQLKMSRIVGRSQGFCKLISLHTARLSPPGLGGTIILIRGSEWLATAPLYTALSHWRNIYLSADVQMLLEDSPDPPGSLVPALFPHP